MARKKYKRLSFDEEQTAKRLLLEGVSPSRVATAIGCSRKAIDNLKARLEQQQRCPTCGYTFSVITGCVKCRAESTNDSRRKLKEYMKWENDLLSPNKEGDEQ